MKLSLPAASLLALALFAVPALSQDQSATGGAPAAEQPAVPAEVTALLDDTRPLSELSNKELTRRIRQARGLIDAGGLDADVTDKLQALIKAARAERMARRQQAQEQPAATADAGAAQPAETQPPIATQIPEDVLAFINGEKPLDRMSRKELRGRLMQARQFMQANKGKPEVRRPLRTIILSVRAELAKRNGEAAQPAEDSATAAQPAEDGATAGQTQPDLGAPGAPTTEGNIPIEVVVFLRDRRPAKDLSMNELQARIGNGEMHLRIVNLAPKVHDRIARQLGLDRTELKRRGEAGELTEPLPPAVQQPPLGAPQDETQLDNNAASPQAEAKAREFLTDPRRAEQLSDADLRARLNGIRALMAGNQLSRETERQLRRKLAAERVVLRARIAAKRNAGAATGGQVGVAGQPEVQIDGGYMTDIDVVLADRRPSERLTDRELRRRVQVYRDAAFDPRYAEADRLRWRDIVVRDRQMLRLHLIDARRARQAELAARRGAGDLNVDIDIVLQPGEPRDVDAAEVDDAEIEDFLVARPRRKIERRYTIAELEDSPTLRDAIPRIEIDTIHFGFDEAFVREEEIDNLDRIAGIMERILAAHPREVFVIEGHTDAVGSDAYNFRLSRQRARAVKQALATYYVIPEENLRTVGYGERFLKIPTADAEAENRRVSIARATALIGEAGE